MRILVIGGTHFIGLALVRRLVEDGHEVAVLNRGETACELPVSVQRIRGNRDALPDSRPEIKDLAPDLVVHNVVSQESHIEGLLEACKGIVSRVVMTSSCDVYRVFGRLKGIEEGAPDHTPQGEDSPLRTALYPHRDNAKDESDSNYYYEKLLAEQRLLSCADVQGSVVRLPMVLGAGDFRHRLADYVRPMLDKRPAIVLHDRYADWRSTYSFVENVAAGMALVCTDPRSAGRVYNLGDHILSIAQLAELVAQELDWNGTIHRLPASELPEELVPQFKVEHWLMTSDERIRSELGYVPRLSLEEGMRQNVEWEVQHPADSDDDDPPPYEAEDRVLAGLRKTG